MIERLVRVLIAVGAFVTGVTSAVIGSWISSRIHVYEEHRRVHLEALRDKVLVPMRTGLLAVFGAPTSNRDGGARRQNIQSKCKGH
jgi:hypothetical protein